MKKFLKRMAISFCFMLCVMSCFLLTGSEKNALSNAHISSEVQEMINCLPEKEDLESFSNLELEKVYETAQEIFDAYELLSEDEQETVDIEKLENLMNYFNSQTSSTSSYQIIMGYDKDEKNGGFLDASNTSGSCFKFDPETNTLTLDGAELYRHGNNFKDKDRAMIYVTPNAGISLTINIAYKSTLNKESDATSDKRDNCYFFGIYAPGNDIRINTGLSETYCLNIYAQKDAIYCRNLVINGYVNTYSAWGTAINCTNLTVYGGRVSAQTNHGNGKYLALSGQNNVSAIKVSEKFVIYENAMVKSDVYNTINKSSSDQNMLTPSVSSTNADYVEINGGTLTCNVVWQEKQGVVDSEKLYSYALKTNSIILRDDGHLNLDNTIKNTALDKSKIDFEIKSLEALQGDDVDIYISNKCTMTTMVYYEGCSASYTDALKSNDFDTLDIHIMRYGVKFVRTPNHYQSADAYIWYASSSNFMYLREQDGKKQYSYTQDFSSDVYTFSDAVAESFVEMNHYLDSDSKQPNICVLSGDFTISVSDLDRSEHTYIALGGSVTLAFIQDTFDKINLYVREGASISIRGTGTIKEVCGNGCNSRGDFASIDDDKVTYGTINFLRGTVLSGEIKNVKSYITGGNINLSEAEMYDKNNNRVYKHTYTFKGFDDSFKASEDLKLNTSDSYELRGFYPIGKTFYLWNDGTYTEKQLYDSYGTKVGTYNVYYFNYLIMHIYAGGKNGTYRLYAKKVADKTFELYRPEEKYILKDYNGNSHFVMSYSSVTLDAGKLVKVVDYPDVSGYVELTSPTTTLPSGFKSVWSWIDKNGNTQVLDCFDFSYTIDNVSNEDDFRDYSFNVYADDGETLVVSYGFRIYVMQQSWSIVNRQGNVGDTVTFNFGIEKKSEFYRDDWVSSYEFIWQVDKTGNGDFVDIEGTTNLESYSVLVENIDMYNWNYRVRCYSNFYYYKNIYSNMAQITTRPAPYFDTIYATPEISNGKIEVLNGSSLYIGPSPQNAFVDYVNLWWEVSFDGGSRFEVVEKNDNISFTQGFISTIIMGSSGNQITTQKYLIYSISFARVNNELDGAIIRCVMKDGDVYQYCTVEISVLDFPEFSKHPKTTTVTALEDANLSVEHETNENVTIKSYQWQWFRSNYNQWVDIEGGNQATLQSPQLKTDEKTKYRCVVKLEYNNGETIEEITHYSDVAYLYYVSAPTFGDDGVIDYLGDEGDDISLSITLEQNKNRPNKIVWELSKDGGLTWTNASDVLTDTDENYQIFKITNLTDETSGLYRCKVTSEENGVSASSYSKVVAISVVKTPSIDKDSSSSVCRFDDVANINVKHDMSATGVSVTYEWQYKKDVLTWLNVSDLVLENNEIVGFNTKSLKINDFEFAKTYSPALCFRCKVTYTAGETTKEFYTDETSVNVIYAPEFSKDLSNIEVWHGETANFQISYSNSMNSTYSHLWEVSKDNGLTWEEIEIDYSGVLIIIPTRYSTVVDETMNGYVYRCTVTRTESGVSVSATSKTSVLTVKMVKDKESLSDALEYGLKTIKLFGDIDLTETMIVSYDLTIDLNGFVLKYSGKESGSVIKIDSDNSNVSLTVIDSNPNSVHEDKTLPNGGVITGGTGFSNKGGGIYIQNGSLNFNGGTIFNCSATYGGGIYIGKSDSNTNEITLKINGGKIENCTALGGGGIYTIKIDDINIKNSSITSCNATNFGGGMLMSYNGDVKIENLLISNCSAGYGGGIYLSAQNTATFTFESGTISDCTADYGGAVCVNHYDFVANDGLFKNCSAKEQGGAFYVINNGTVSLNSVKILDCTASENGGDSFYLEMGSLTLSGNSAVCYENKNCYYSIYATENAKIYAEGGTVEGDLHIDSLVTRSETAVLSTNFLGNVSGNSTIKAGTFYSGLSDLEYEGLAVKFMNNDELYAIQVLQGGEIASYPITPKGDNLFIGWFNGDEIYTFSQSVTSDLVLEARWGVSQEKYDELKKKYDDLKNTLTEIETKYNDLQNSLNDLNDFQSKYNELQNSLSEMQGKYNELQNSLSEMQEKYSELQNTLSEMQGKYSDLQNSLSEMQGKYNGLQNSLSEMQEKYSDLQNSLSEMQGKYNELQNSLSEMQEKYEKVQSDLEKLNTELTGKLEDLQEKYEKVQSDLEKLNTELTGKLEDLQEKYEKVQSDLEKLNTELTSKLEDLQEKYDDLLKKYNDLEEKYNNLSDKTNGINNDYVYANEKLKLELSNEIETLKVMVIILASVVVLLIVGVVTMFVLLKKKKLN